MPALPPQTLRSKYIDDPGSRGLTSQFMAKVIQLVPVRGNIAIRQIEGVVNASNTDLKLGSGVSGALRVQCGPVLQEELDAIAPVEHGEVVATEVEGQPYRYVLHAAIIDFHKSPGQQTSLQVLSTCLDNVLTLADQLGLRSLAIPLLGAGVGCLDPAEVAERIRLHVQQHGHFSSETPLERVELVYFEKFG